MGTIGNLTGKISLDDEQPDPKAVTVESAPAPEVAPRRKPARIQAAPEPPINAGGGYESFAPLTARLGPEQIDDLDRVARELNRLRVNRAAPRITKNTLLRVAVDLLLQNEAKLSGDTAQDLLDSLS